MSNKKRLTLASENNSQCEGVCGGFAEYFDIDPTIVRILFVILAICTGVLSMLFIYVIFSLIMPDPDDETDSDADSRLRT